MKKPITNMRLERIKRDKSQRELSEVLGTSQQYYLKLELLRTKPSDERVEQLEEYFDKPIEYLLSVAE